MDGSDSDGFDTVEEDEENRSSCTQAKLGLGAEPEPEPEPEPATLLDLINLLRTANPGLGVKKVCAEVKKNPLFAEVATKDIREALAAAEAELKVQAQNHPSQLPTGPDPEPEQSESRSERRAKAREAQKKKKPARARVYDGWDKDDPALAEKKRVVHGAFCSGGSSGSAVDHNSTEKMRHVGVEMQRRLAEFLEREEREGMVPAEVVGHLNSFFIRTQAELAKEAEEIQRRWKLDSAILSRGGTDGRKLSQASLRCDATQRRSEQYNADAAM